MKRVRNSFTLATISGTRFPQHVSSWRSLWGFLTIEKKTETERGERREGRKKRQRGKGGEEGGRRKGKKFLRRDIA